MSGINIIQIQLLITGINRNYSFKNPNQIIMLSIIKHGVILEKSENDFENEAVSNPAAIMYKGEIYMFYRAVRKGNHSSVGYCILDTPTSVKQRFTKAILKPEFDYECHGMEDPRIVMIDNLFYMSYTAYDGVNAMGALAVSADLITWQKRGIIVPKLTYNEFHSIAESKELLNAKYARFNEHSRNYQDLTNNKILLWDKNLIFFPRKVNNKFYFIHRIKPDIQIVEGIDQLSDLNANFWNEYLKHINDHILLSSKYHHEISYVGGGCPPIETRAGWLLIYHGVHDAVSGYIYCACAALLDINNPKKVITRLPYPLFKPEQSWELKGEVNNVCFPSGAIVVDETLYIYYGAADERIACASVNLDALLNELMLNAYQNEQ